MNDEIIVLIFGVGKIAEVAFYYLTHDNKYKTHKIAGFVIENAYKTMDCFHELPVFSYENIEDFFIPEQTVIFAPVGGTHLNKDRERIYNSIKSKGFNTMSYISSKATIMTEYIGDNCFILEDNTIQPYVTIGNNVILWSGNHIGHHSIIHNHVFITSHVVISGCCTVGQYAYIGVNACLKDYLNIAPNTVIGMGSVVTKNTESYNIYIGSPAKIYSQCTDNIKI